MDGPVFRNPLNLPLNLFIPFSIGRIFSLSLAIAVCGLVLPGALRGQAMGKAQVEAIATVHLTPLTSAAPTVSVVTPELVALADTKSPKATDEEPAKSAAVVATKSEPVQPNVSPATKSTLPAADFAPASQPAPAPVTVPVPSPTTPSAIESSLIRPTNASQPSGTITTSTSTGALPGESSMYSRFQQVIQVGGALAVVLGLIYIGRALMRKYVPGAAVASGKGVMEVMARYPLAKNQSLVLVRIGSQLVVLNQTKDASQSVLVIHDQVEVANILGQIQGAKPASIQQGFSNLLANARMDLEGTPPTSDANIELGDLDSQLDEMAAAKRQLMELRQQVRSVRESMPA